MNAFLSTVVLLAGLTQASSGVATQPSDSSVTTSRAPLAIPEQASNPQVVTSTVIRSGDSFIGEPLWPAQAQENVLVVPTPDLAAESLADLTEDLTVMCRIFDKSLPATYAATSTMYGMYGEPGTVFHYSPGRQSRQAQALYLDGYGALFFVHVGYPLVPAEPQPQSQAKTPESVDTVWSQTVQEMSGQPGDEQQTARRAQTFDPRKVENLKETLIKTLVHTANLRMRRPQDVVTLVVGAWDDNRSGGLWGQVGVRTGTSRSWGKLGQLEATGAKATARTSAAGLLVLRVTKADVDAFAKGQLTLAQFTEKVQILSLPTGPGAPAASKTAPAPVSSR